MGRKNTWILPFLILLRPLIVTGEGVSAGIQVGDEGTAVWIGGGELDPPTFDGTTSALSKAYIALHAWKSAITADPLGILKSWTGQDVCSYKGIFCSESSDILGNPTGKAVAAVDLNHARLEGTLVKELSLLTDLSLLHLNSNRFNGTIPTTLKDLTSLTELDLSSNQFSGSFPRQVLAIPNLIYLDLRFNSFSGPIPDDLFNIKLDAIFLNNNLFDGQLPDSLANSPASVINLANNRLTGSIPFSLGYMGIKEILFLNNKLTGCVPEGLGLWTDLQVLDVSSNSLTGHLPDSLSCLGNIEVLNLAHNRLSGMVPDLVCSLRRLMNLTVSENFFSGFSQDCDDLFNRNVGFEFSWNCIPGREMQRPQDDCTGVPENGLSCLRIPAAARSLICGAGPLIATAPTP